MVTGFPFGCSGLPISEMKPSVPHPHNDHLRLSTNRFDLGTWNHVVDYCCAGIVDFEPTTTFAGRILAVGLAAYEWNLGGVANEKQDQLERFTQNCISYLK